MDENWRDKLVRDNKTVVKVSAPLDLTEGLDTFRVNLLESDKELTGEEAEAHIKALVYGTAPLHVVKSKLKYTKRDDLVWSRNQQLKLLKSMVEKEANETGDLLALLDRFKVVVDQYQEQPHLLDPHLESLMAQLLSIARDEKSPEPVIHLAFKLLYLITKTRGYKVIVRLMPHEVADVEPVLALLAKQSPTDFQTWESRYMLLLWLSIVCMIPFDMVKLDSNMRTDAGDFRKPIMERIIEVGKLYIDVSDKSRDAAAYMLSRFMTRPDVKKQKLPEFIEWSLNRLTPERLLSMAGMSTLAGILSTLALLFKFGKREDLVPYGSKIFKTLSDLNLTESSNTYLRKYHTKITQRIGLAFLKSKVAAWRYQRGSRSLAANLTSSQPKQDGASQQAEDDEEYDIPDDIEDVIEMLLNRLRDKDTVVRWSAAKGIGRLTGRLPQELADEVVGSLMELFTIGETDGAWHGACLSLAELGRRGLLLPQRLNDVVPVIIKALRYDEKRGNFSVGAHVRDAACYVCWAFARAYDPEEIAPHVNRISTALVLVSVFDREVNVRRAAAAAFQENVGRQGQFPHGIDILTTCDYFAVGNRNNCFLELSVFVAQFADYTNSMIDHLVEVKICHWDQAIRELAAQGLHNLTEKAPAYMSEKVLPKLLENIGSIDLNLRHGSILAFAEIIHALAELQFLENKCLYGRLSAEIIQGVKGTVDKLEKAQLFKGHSGDFMRKAVCSLIQKCSLSGLPFHGDDVIATWQDFIDSCLQQCVVEVQAAAQSAIPAFFTEYYKQQDGTCQPQAQEEIMERYIRKLQDHDMATRSGHASAIGAFPKFFMRGKFKLVLTGLIRCSKIHDNDKKMAESRRDALRAITSVCATVGMHAAGDSTSEVCADNLPQVYDTMFEALKDYTTHDSQGDVGAWVREAAMTGLQEFSSMVVKDAPSLFQPDISRVMFCSLVQQSVEKIDRTRAHAGDVFSQLLHHEPPIPSVPCRETLLELFPKKACALINWAAPGDTFRKFTRLLKEPVYTYSILLGLTVSVGGLTESLVKHSAFSLMGYLREIKQDQQQLAAFTNVLLQVFKDYLKVDRVTLPMFKTLDQLLSNNVFEALPDQSQNEFALKLFQLSKAEVNKSGDIPKLLASIDVFTGLLQYEGEVRRKILLQLSIYMCHRYPIVRKNSAGKLFETILMFDGIVEDEKLEELNALLSETQWDHPVDEVRPIRNKICDLLGIKPPVVLKKA